MYICVCLCNNISLNIWRGFIRMPYRVWFRKSNNGYSHWRGGETGSCSGHRTGYLSSPNQVLKTWRIPRDLIFSLCWNLKKIKQIISSFQVLLNLVCHQKVWPRFRTSLLDSNNLIKKTLPGTHSGSQVDNQDYHSIGCRDGSIVKSSSCSSCGPEFNYQHSHGSSQPSITVV